MSASRLCLVAPLLLAVACSSDSNGIDSGNGTGDGSTDGSDADGTGDGGEDDGSVGDGGEDDGSVGDGAGDGTNHDGCGDRLLSVGEECDDGNGAAQDGCSDTCTVEPGYACPVVGALCRAASCGDGILAADEECEDGDAEPNDGCDERCRLEEGFACDTIGQPCRATVCGDGTPEGSEQCDDGAGDVPFDGCYQCKREPTCTNDGCAAVCGDGIKFPGEACDDGNTRGGDGCSETCALEEGFTCTEAVEEPPAAVDLPIVYRDFRGNDLPELPGSGIARGHVDFENKNGEERGLVKALLDADKKPDYAKADGTSSTTASAMMFRKWYRDDAAYNRTIVDTLRFTRNGVGDYAFLDRSFFPLDTRGFVGEGHEPLRGGSADEMGVTQHNFNFTSELRTQFQYKGGEKLDFLGDDDVWVFVNGRLALDLGGVHGAQGGTVQLADDPSGTDDRYAITKGNIYEIVVFQAERHTSASEYQLTLRDFVRAKTSCESICGDGVLTANEACDDGDNPGGYGQCAEGCVFGPRCGDGVVQSEEGEQCDDQNRVDTDECKNDCTSNSPA